MKSLILLTLIAIINMQLLAAEPETITPPEPKGGLEHIIPRKFMALNLENPYVTFFARVSSEGKVSDFVPVSSSYADLIRYAESIISKKKFKPAMANGKPRSADMFCTIRFYYPVFSDGVPLVSQSGGDAERSAFYKNSKDSFRFEESKPKELDAPLAVVEQGTVYVPQDENGNDLSGKATVDFYVDSDGAPRMFQVVDYDDEAIAKAALMTFKEMRFTPPTRKGKETVVRVRMPFQI